MALKIVHTALGLRDYAPNTEAQTRVAAGAGWACGGRILGNLDVGKCWVGVIYVSVTWKHCTWYGADMSAAMKGSVAHNRDKNAQH